MKKIRLIKSGNNYTITDVQILRKGNRGRILFTTYHINDYGSRWNNDDLWVAKNLKALCDFIVSINN
jgi:hypothetical protein